MTSCGDRQILGLLWWSVHNVYKSQSLRHIPETNAIFCVNTQKPKILVSHAKVGMCERGYVPDRGNKHPEVKGGMAYLGF